MVALCQGKLRHLLPGFLLSGLLAGLGFGLVESVLTMPRHVVTHPGLKLLSFLWLPCLVDAAGFLCLDLLVFLALCLAAALAWGRLIRNAVWVFRALHLLALVLLMDQLISLNAARSVVTLLDAFGVVSLVPAILFLAACLSVDPGLSGFLSRRPRLGIAAGMGLPVVVLVAFAGTIWWDSEGGMRAGGMHPAVVPMADARPDNIMLITLDTQRADFLGCYGSRSVSTPNVDRLAEEGVRFDYCVAHSPMTLPSHTSIMTSMLPNHHGVRDNGTYRAASSLVTLAEILRNHGYDTAGFVSSYVLSRGFGLDQGFGTFEKHDNHQSVFFSRFSEGLFFPNVILPHLPFLGVLRGDRLEVSTRRAIEWIGRQRSAPFFLWLHLFMPHGPYAPPPPYAASCLRRAHPDPGGAVSVYTADGEIWMSRWEIERSKALYRGEIEYTDENVGRLLDALAANGELSRTLIVMTGDHGEAFGENHDIKHSHILFDTAIRVPLLFRRPGRIPANTIVRGLAQSVDIMPTILDHLGIEGPEGMDGISLLPSMRGSASLPARSAYLETMASTAEDRKLVGLVDGRWKYTMAPFGTAEALYDLDSEAAELVNRIADEPERARRMRNTLREICRSGVATDRGDRIELDEESRETLRALGYVR